MAGNSSSWTEVLIAEASDLVFRCLDGRIAYANRAACSVLGYAKPDRLLGRDFTDFVHEDYAEFLQPILSGAENDPRVPVRLVTARGKGVNVDLRLVRLLPEPDEDPSSTCYGVVGHDVTERMRSAEALVRSEIQFRGLVEQSIDFMCLCEDQTIKFLNPAGMRLIGITDARKVVGKPLKNILHKDYRPLLDDGLAALAELAEIIPLKLLRRDKSVVDVECAVMPAPNPRVFIVECRDITARLQSAARLCEREEMLQGIVDSVAEGILTVDAEGRLRSFNRAAVKIFGRTAAEVLDRPIDDLIPDYLPGASAGGKGKAGRRNLSPVDGEPRRLLGRRENGESFPLEVSLSELRKGRRRLLIGVVRDITERLSAEETLRRSTEELERRVAERTDALTQEIAERRRAEETLKLTARVIEATREGVLIADAGFRVTSVNPAYTKITGYPAEEVIGRRPPFHAVLNKDRKAFERMMSDLTRKSHWEGELWNTRRDGSRYAQRLSISAIRKEDGVLQHYAVVVSDITRRKEDEERIRFQANYDTLTGLPNRTLFRDRLDQALATAHRHRDKVVLLFLDLDGFKLVNDTLGHDMGDLLLKQAAERLLGCVRETDTVARLGGDEFTVILTEVVDEKHAPVVAQRVIDALAQPFELDDQEAFVSASIGITTFPDDSDTATDLLKNADAAMYLAKEKGKANFQYFTADINEAVKERLFLKNGLSMALGRAEFELFYQPKMGLQDNWITGVEALMRWRHPDLGMVSPGRFIPVLEESGMVVDVGIWVLREACAQHVHWLNAGLPPLRVAVNLSARQLRDPALVDVVHSVLEETGVGPQALEIEITESMLMSEYGPVTRVLGTLHEMGLHVAMDDFGTGYSSLSYLKRFPIDTIKIDRSFVADIAVDSDDAEIIRTIINMGQSLKRRVVAEGVETAEQLDILKTYNCHEVQGYFYSRPLPAGQVTDFVGNLIRSSKPDAT